MVKRTHYQCRSHLALVRCGNRLTWVFSELWQLFMKPVCSRFAEPHLVCLCQEELMQNSPSAFLWHHCTMKSDFHDFGKSDLWFCLWTLVSMFFHIFVSGIGATQEAKAKATAFAHVQESWESFAPDSQLSDDIVEHRFCCIQVFVQRKSRQFVLQGNGFVHMSCHCWDKVADQWPVMQFLGINFLLVTQIFCF